MIPDPSTFPLTPAEIRRALRRYRLAAAAFFLVVSGIAFGGSFFMPKSFTSEAKIFVRVGRENLALDPTTTTGQVISINETRESEINSLLEVMRSRALVDQAVARIGAKNILAGRIGRDESSATTLVSLEENPSSAEPEPVFGKIHQQAVQALEKSVSVHTPRRSNVISVSAKSPTPELAQRIVDELVHLYLQEHTRVNSTAGAYDFFAEQTEKLRGEWEQSLENLRKAKDRYEIVTVEGKRAALEARIAQIQSQQAATEAELSQSRGRSESLTKLLAQVPETLATAETDGFPNIPSDSARSGYHALQLQATDLLSRYSEDHPQVRLIRQRLEEGRKTLDDDAEPRVQTTRGRHPTRMALELALLNERANSESLNARREALAHSSTETAEELQHLNRQEVEIAGLQKQVELASSQFQQASEKLAQARVSRQLDRDGISNLRLVQPASFNAKPKGLGKKVVWALGGFTAVVGAFGLALILAWLNPQLSSPREVEAALGVPVLATIRRRHHSLAAPSFIETPVPA